MKFPSISRLGAFGLLATTLGGLVDLSTCQKTSDPIQDNGLTDLVQWWENTVARSMVLADLLLPGIPTAISSTEKDSLSSRAR